MGDAGDRPQGLRPSQTSANSCENLRLYGRCKFGDDCFYAHSQEESELFSQWARSQKRQQNADRGPPDRYFRTQICQRWREGTCRNGAACTFAHGEEALRAPRPRPQPAAGDRPEGQQKPVGSERPRWEPERPSGHAQDGGEGAHAPSPYRPRGQLLCRYWHDLGNCRHGDQCQYMHGERRRLEDDVPPCFERSGSGGPRGGERGDGEWVCRSEKYKTQLCLYFMEQGYCRHGDSCTFAHGMHELPRHRRDAILADEGAYRGPPGGHPEPEGDFFDSWGSSSGGPPRRNSGYLPRTGSSGAHVPPPPPPAAPPSYGPSPPPAAPPSYGPSPAASGSLDPTPSEQAMVRQGQQQPQRTSSGRTPYNPLAAIMPLPSLTSSDGGVALSDDDFPPLGRPSATPSVRSVPSMKSLASVVAAEGAGTGSAKLLPPTVAAVRAEQQGQSSSGGPSTPSRASAGAAAGPASIMGSPALSEAGRPSRASSAPPGARSAGAAASAASAAVTRAAAPLPRSASAGSLASSQDGGAGSEGAAGAAVAEAAGQGSYPASVDGSGYQAGTSSSGYETAEEEAGQGASGNPEVAAEATLSEVPAAVPAEQPSAAEVASASPVSFLAPTSLRAKPEPPVAVTFNASGSGGLSPQGSVDMDASMPHGSPLAGPPGYEKAHAYPVAAPQQEQPPTAADGGEAAGSPPAPSPGSPPGSAQRPARPDSAAAAPPHLPVQAIAAPAAAAAASVLPPIVPPVYSVASVHSFRCPISKCLFTDPVVAADGFTYERAAIHDYLYRQNLDVSPVTQLPLVHKILVPNMTMRGVMNEVGHLLACMAAPLVPLAPVPVAPAAAPTAPATGAGTGPSSYRPPLAQQPAAAP